MAKNGKNNKKTEPTPIPAGKTGRLKKEFYEKELRRLQVDLVKLQEWVRHEGLKVVVIFEGRDAAGKGGVIKRITERLSPRIARVVALGVPTEREKSHTSNAMSHICQPPERWCCLTAVGITAPASNG